MSQLQPTGPKPQHFAGLTAGVHHVGLSVDDLSAASEFLIQQLGFELVGERPDYPARFVSDGHTMLTLWQVQDPAHCRAFDRHRQVGLHHLALKLSEGQSLAVLHARLAGQTGVSIEFAPASIGTTGLRHFICQVPGGLRLEFVSDV